jgi:hypothetical protein
MLEFGRTRHIEGVSMMDAMTVPVAVVSSRTEAALIVGLLESNGVRAWAVTDDAGGQEPQWQLEGVRVLVASSDAVLAGRLLSETATDRDADG